MSAPDLFTWREEAEAAAAVREAEAVRAQAALKAKYPPHGSAQARRAELARATREALLAEVELQRVHRVGR